MTELQLALDLHARMIDELERMKYTYDNAYMERINKCMYCDEENTTRTKIFQLQNRNSYCEIIACQKHQIIVTKFLEHVKSAFDEFNKLFDNYSSMSLLSFYGKDSIIVVDGQNLKRLYNISNINKLMKI